MLRRRVLAFVILLSLILLLIPQSTLAGCCTCRRVPLNVPAYDLERAFETGNYQVYPFEDNSAIGTTCRARERTTVEGGTLYMCTWQHATCQLVQRAAGGGTCQTNTDCRVSGLVCLNHACVAPPPPLPPGEPIPEPLLPNLQIQLPTLQPFTEPRATVVGEKTFIDVDFLAQYIAAWYKYLVAIAGVMAGVMIIWAGVRWLTSEGNPEKLNSAKHKIAGAIVGLVLVLGSYTILYLVNPELVLLKPLRVQYVERIILKVDEAQAGPGDVGVGTANVPYFGQYSPPWGEKKPGDEGWTFANPRPDCQTIRQRGCGTTSLAMVLAYYGETVTPLETAGWGLGCRGAWQPSTTISGISRKWPRFTGEVIYKNNIDRALELVRRGKPIIYNCSPCTGYKADGTPQPRPYSTGHFLVLTGIDAQGHITVNDPGRNAQGRTDYFTEEQIRQEFKVAVYVYPK